MNQPQLHKGDIPSDIQWGKSVSVDTETMGLNLFRDRLCLIQMAAENGDVHIVQFAAGQPFNAPNLKALMANTHILKIFHFARFDINFIHKFLGVMPHPLYCTKIASKLVRTYTEKHGLKELVRECLNIDLTKDQQSSDWGADTLTERQLEYAAKDVIYLHKLRDNLDERLKREHRYHLAQACFDFLPHRAALDLLGLEKDDIFTH